MLEVSASLVFLLPGSTCFIRHPSLPCTFCSSPILLDIFWVPFFCLLPLFPQNHHCNPDLQTLENCSKPSGLKTTQCNKHIKRCSASLVNRKVQISNHEDSISHLSDGQNLKSNHVGCVCKPVEQLELPNTAGRNADWHGCSGEQSGNMGVSKMPISFDSAISLLGRDHRETLSTCTGDRFKAAHRSKMATHKC